MKLVTDSERVAQWVGARIDMGQFCPPYVALGWEDEHGELKGGAVFNNWTGSNVELSIAGRGVVTRQAFRTIADYCFRQLGCRRISMHTKAENLRLIMQAKRCGFAHEGFRKDFYPDDDAVALVMLRSHCKW